jgi:predicted  nucleic acid-binding Zn-ribbon protein
LKPRQEYVRLFTAIVLDVWKERQASAILQVAALEDRLKALKERKQQLLDALVYRQIIAKDDFDEQYAQIKEEMTLTEMHRDELKGEELDVEGALAFSQHVMRNAARRW